MQKILWSGASVLFLAALVGTPSVGRAQAAPNFGSPPSGVIPILYNDTHVYTKPDVLKQDRVLAALVRNGTILIPLRSMFEQMGATVSYDASTHSVTATKPGATVTVTLGKPEVVINGESRPLDVPPIMYHGVLLVPVRVISEGMGAYVQWLQDRHIVVVRYIPPTPPPPPATAPPPPPALPPPTPKPFNWTGFYVGANVGAVMNHDTGVAVCSYLGIKYDPECFYPAFGMMNSAGFLGGVQVGANWQLGHLVIGPEFDYQGSTLQQSTQFVGLLCEHQVPCLAVAQGNYHAAESMTSFQTERLRVGWATGKTLVYLTGGWAQANWTLSSSAAFSNGNSFGSGSTSLQRSGWTEGLGGEWYLNPRLSFKVEGLLYTLQPYEAYFDTAYLPTLMEGKDFYFHGGVARIGLNWKL